MSNRMKTTIKVQKPYNFDLSARIFADGDPQIRKYENGAFWQVLRINTKLILVKVKSSKNPHNSDLSVELVSNEPISDEDVESTKKIIFYIFNLDFDLLPFYKDMKDDKIMSKLIQSLAGLKNPTTPTIFESLVDSIIEQQISLKVAHIIERKMIKTFGSTLDIDGVVYYAYPTPNQLNNATNDQLRECGLSFRKVEYIKDISKLIIEGKLNLEKFKEYDDMNQIVDELCEIRGVGIWTAELTVLRGLNKVEAIPADDIGLQRVISHFYCDGNKISSQKVRIIAKNWGKWKGLAAFYLIMAEMININI